MSKQNNVKGMVWAEVRETSRPITVTDVVEKFDNVAPNAIYGAFESLKPYVRGMPTRKKRYIATDTGDFAWRIQRMTANTPMTVKEIAVESGLSKDMVQWYLDKLVESDKILQKKVNRKFYYCVQDAFDVLLRYCTKCQRDVEYSNRGRQWQCMNCGKFSL